VSGDVLFGVGHVTMGMRPDIFLKSGYAHKRCITRDWNLAGEFAASSRPLI